MRIAQMSDLHYADKTLAEVDRCFGFAVDQAIARQVNAVVISGDSTDHELDVHSPAIAALASQVRRLADHCPVLMLQGTFSHEPPGTLNIFRLLGGEFGVHVADSIRQVVLTKDGSWIESADWRFDEAPEGAECVFSCLPSINKGAVAAAVGAVHAAEALGDTIGALLQGFGAVNRRLRERDVITGGVSHGTVNGCITEHGVPMAGLDHEFTVGSLFAAEASAFMLGHIHRHQAWEASGRRIAYPGSIGRLHYGEEGDKGFLIWDVTRDSATFEFVPTPARRMLHFEFRGKPDLEQLKTRLAEVDRAFVRVRWVIPEEDRASVDLDAMRALLSKAAEVKLEERVVPVVRTRAAGIKQAHTLAEKLAKWASTAEVEEAPLLERLQLLESTEPETIVGELLREETNSVNLGRSEKHMNFHSHETDRREPKTSGKRNVAAAHRLESQLAEAS